MNILKQSTAVDVLIGPFVDSTDGYTAEVGVSPAVKLSKNGQALAAKNDVTPPVHDADGYYNCELDATDTGTVGTMVLSVVGGAVSLPVRHEYQVVEEAVYDAFYAAAATGVPAAAATSAAQTTAQTDLDTLTGSDGVTLATAQGNYAPAKATDIVSAGAITTSAGAVSNVTLVATTTTNTDMRGTDSAATATALATVDGNVDAILVDTGTTLPASLATIDGNVDSVLTDTGTTLPASISTIDTNVDAIQVITDALTSAAATKLAASMLGLVNTSVNDASASTTAFVITSTEATDDHFNGGVIIFTSGALINQRTDITDYTGSSKTVTVTALTEAPGNGDTFVIV